MVSYSRNGRPLDWDGMMIFTRKHFSRNYMARKRPVFGSDVINRAELSAEEKNNVVEALVQKFAADAGTYRVEGDHLYFDIDVAKTPSNVGRRGSGRRYAFAQGGQRLLLKGTMASGISVEEVWEKTE